jgi:hypothetical protein
MIIKCTPTLGVTLVRKSWMFRTLVEKENKHQLGLQDTIRKVLECGCLKWPLIVHLDLICMSYDQKKGHKFNFWPQMPLQQGSNDHQLGNVIQCWKDVFECYNILFSHDSNMFDLRKIWTFKVLGKQKLQFWDSHLGVPRKNVIWM